ncbi:hypothetical protein ACRAWC_13805 [Leifsonia sp. L25]|uniref:hypothetical protein n=1 Tax=Actinomycetes TaxID=1760 RepID=UPI003D684E36
MNNFQIALPVIEPDEPPRVDVHYEWTQYPLWLDGKYGIDSVDGHEIGLSPELVRDLRAWSGSADAQFNADDPPSSTVPANFLEDGFELAKRVRAELPAEWIVTSYDPRARRKVTLTPEG